MPSGSVRVGGSHVTFSADSTRYLAGTTAAINANRQFRASFTGMNVALDRFRTSLSSSLIATAGYAAGVGAVSAAVRSSVGGFLDYDEGLIKISKTTGIAGSSLDKLGESLSDINTKAEGSRRAIAVTRDDLFGIAEAAGQAGVQQVRNVEILSRASAALQLSSDLIGRDAVRGVTRYLQVTNQGIDRTNAIASAFTHLGNNVVGTESEISRFAVRVSQNLSAVGKATDGLILGISATLLEAGVEQEAAGSALQRAQLGLQNAAGDQELFRFLAEQSGDAAEALEIVRQRFVDGTANAEDYDRALLALLRTFRNLPSVGTDQLPGRQSFLAEVIGGGESNVRNTRVLAALSNRYERLERNIGLANEGLDSQNAHFEEAARAAEAYRNRLRVVGQQLLRQNTVIGSHIVPGLVTIAENFRVLEVAALGFGTAFLTAFGRRRIQNFRSFLSETALQTRQQLVAAQLASDQANRRLQTRASERATARRVAAQAYVAGGAVPTRDVNALARANRNYARQAEKARRAQQALNIAQRNAVANAVTLRNVTRRLGVGLLNLAGGPVGLLLTGITVVSAAFALFGSRADDAGSSIEDLEQRVQDILDTLGNAGPLAGLTPDAQTLVALDREIERVQGRLEAAREALVSPDLDPFQRFQASLEVGNIEGELEAVRELREELVEAAREIGQELPEPGAVLEESFERLGPSLQPAIDAVVKFRRQLEDLARVARQRALTDRLVAGLSDADTERTLAIRRAQVQLEDRLLEATRQVADARANLADSEERLAAATRARDETAILTPARAEAEKQLEATEKTVEKNRENLTVLEELLRLLLQVRVSEEAITQAVDEQREARAQRALEARAATVVPDLAGSRREAANVLRDQNRELEDAIRLSEQEAELRVQSSARAEAGLRSLFDVENAYFERRREAEDRANAARAELASTSARLATVQERLASAGADYQDELISQVESLKSAEQSQRATLAEAEALRDAIYGQADAWRENSFAVQEFTRGQFRNSIQDLADEAGRLRDSLIEVATDGFGHLEDELLSLFEDGKFSVKELAQAIAIDLVAALIRATITANLARAALSFFPGLAGQEATALVPPARPFHQGGVAGSGGRARPLGARLGAREIFAVLEQDEEVITRRDPRHRWNVGYQSMADIRRWVAALPRYHSGGVAGGRGAGAVPGGFDGVRVEIVNETGQPVDYVDGGQRIDLDTLVVSAFMRNIKRNGIIAQTLRRR